MQNYTFNILQIYIKYTFRKKMKKIGHLKDAPSQPSQFHHSSCYYKQF